VNKAEFDHATGFPEKAQNADCSGPQPHGIPALTVGQLRSNKEAKKVISHATALLVLRE
jgi:hypothetical protein